MTTDIVALQREYAHLRQKRKNMHVIFNDLSGSNLPRVPEMSSQVGNQTLTSPSSLSPLAIPEPFVFKTVPIGNKQTYEEFLDSITPQVIGDTKCILIQKEKVALEKRRTRKRSEHCLDTVTDTCNCSISNPINSAESPIRNHISELQNMSSNVVKTIVMTYKEKNMCGAQQKERQRENCSVNDSESDMKSNENTNENNNSSKDKYCNLKEQDKNNEITVSVSPKLADMSELETPNDKLHISDKEKQSKESERNCVERNIAENSGDFSNKTYENTATTNGSCCKNIPLRDQTSNLEKTSDSPAILPVSASIHNYRNVGRLNGRSISLNFDPTFSKSLPNVSAEVKANIYHHFCTKKRHLSVDSATSVQPQAPSKVVSPFPVQHQNKNRFKIGLRLGMYQEKKPV